MTPTQHVQTGFPTCVNLSIEFNAHAVLYESAEEWVLDNEGDNSWFAWVSPAEREKAITTDSIWTCQWYPDTPGGFCGLAASSFDALMAAVLQPTDRT